MIKIVHNDDYKILIKELDTKGFLVWIILYRMYGYIYAISLSLARLVVKPNACTIQFASKNIKETIKTKNDGLCVATEDFIYRVKLKTCNKLK